MDFYDKASRAFGLLGGQNASTSSDGSGIQVLCQCPQCQRIWLQDGKSAILDLNEQQVQTFVQMLNADLKRLPLFVCRICLWRQHGGTISIDEYEQGESFGFCWEIPQPILIHALSAIQTKKAAENWNSKADVLTQKEKLLAILSFLKGAQPPLSIDELPPIFGRMQAAELRPGFGQVGTERWQWHVWSFSLACPALDVDHDTMVTFTLALAPDEPLSPLGAFHIWQMLLGFTLDSGVVGGHL